MNKLAVVLGAAVVVTLAGCVDPTYVKPGDRVATKPKTVEPAPAPEEKPAAKPAAKPVEKPEELVVVETEKSCMCAPGTKHAEPCGCGAADCACAVEKPAPVEKPALEETTDYIVQRGDYLAKISKKYNVTIAAIKRVNPKLKGDTIRIGQKIKLPGKIDVGEQTVPKGSFAVTPKPAPKAYAPYAGATKEYTIKSGDTLGAIAYGNGINIRQLKEMNGLKTNNIRVGQKIKIPAEKVEAKKAAEKVEAKKVEVKKAEPKAVETKKVVEEKSPALEAKPATEEAPEETAAPVETTVVETKPAATSTAEDYVTYVVQEGEDIVALSLCFSVSPSEIRELNNLGEADQVKAGQKIRLPANTQL